MTTKTEMTLENVCFRYDGSKEAKECFCAFREKTKCLWSPQEGMIYGIVDNKPKIDFAPVIGFIEISPSDYLLLLSAPESQAHLLTEKDRHELEYNMHSKGITWCPICKEHFYNEVPFHIIESKLASQPPVMEGKEESDSKLIDTAKKLAKAISDQKQMQDNLESSVSKTEKLSEILTIEQANIVQEIMTEVFTEYNKILLSLQSEVEQLKGLLQELVDIQNGPPLEQHKNEWREIMDKCYSILSK